jgi:hypothetical protein
MHVLSLLSLLPLLAPPLPHLTFLFSLSLSLSLPSPLASPLIFFCSLCALECYRVLCECFALPKMQKLEWSKKG